MQKIYIIANWKMNGTTHNTENIKYFNEELQLSNNVEVIICPPLHILYELQKHDTKNLFSWGAQHLYPSSSFGSVTGAINPMMAKDIGCKYAIVGHSERRSIFKETDLDVFNQFISIQQQGLVPILCVGESKSHYDESKTEEIIEKQLQYVLSEKQQLQKSHFIIAYEPIWAIGTNTTPDNNYINSVTKFIRNLCNKHNISPSIIYGGSANENNVTDIISNTDTEGFLIGKASLQRDSFSYIIKQLVTHNPYSN